MLSLKSASLLMMALKHGIWGTPVHQIDKAACYRLMDLLPDDSMTTGICGFLSRLTCIPNTSFIPTLQVHEHFRFQTHHAFFAFRTLSLNIVSLSQFRALVSLTACWVTVKHQPLQIHDHSLSGRKKLVEGLGYSKAPTTANP